MDKFDRLANATLRIEVGNSTGSGFHLMDKQIIVTNFHVVECAISDPSLPIIGITETGNRYKLEVIDSSNKSLFDFAILRSIDTINENREVLKPKIHEKVARGTDILFAGYPHGIPHLLVHKAIVSGYPDEKSFYIDGSVNGGNSGGPIVDANDLTVIGIVTQRRFLGGNDLHLMAIEASRLKEHCLQLGEGTVNIMGVDFASLGKMIGQSLEVSSSIIELNANSGIGIGFNIKYVMEKLLRMSC